jgi:integration host factor subunit beta
MNRPDLVENCTLRLNRLPLGKVEVAVNVIIELMSETLAKGERIEIRGFGSFEVRETKARTGRNPKSGEPAIIAASHKPHFKPGKEMRERVNATK